MDLDHSCHQLLPSVEYCLNLSLIVTCFRPGRSPTAPTATILDTFLRITSTALLARYGNHYLDLLRVVLKTVVPNLTEENGMLQASVHKERLVFFLETFLNSGGNECLEP